MDFPYQSWSIKITLAKNENIGFLKCGKREKSKCTEKVTNGKTLKQETLLNTILKWIGIWLKAILQKEDHLNEK